MNKDMFFTGLGMIALEIFAMLGYLAYTVLNWQMIVNYIPLIIIGLFGVGFNTLAFGFILRGIWKDGD